MSEEETYIITLRRKGKETIMNFNVGSKDRSTTLIRLKGRKTQMIFNEIISALAKYGAITTLKTSEKEDAYAIRDDLGPIIGGFLILVRRSVKPRKWIDVLNDTLDGKHPALVAAFENFLTMTLDLSKIERSNDKTISPIVLDAMSSSLKTLTTMLIKEEVP